MAMKVTGYGTIKPTSTTRKRDGTSSGVSFGDFLSSAQSTTSGNSTVSDVSATASLSSLLALQEISEEERRRQQVIKRGKDMLDSLDRLRQQLLMGEIPAHMLGELSQQLEQQKQEITDPRLMQLIEEIELRLAVELAKLEMAFASKAEI